MPALNLSIPQPCHENWQQMTPQDHGRHCSACQKVVVDFTAMSDQQVLDYMRQATSSVCGRFNNDQLNKRYHDVPTRQPFSFAYGWSVLIGTLLLTVPSASAQSREYMVGMVAPERVSEPKPFWSLANAIHKPSFREMAWHT